MAEREGFEPSVPIQSEHSLSRRASSATPAPLQLKELDSFRRAKVQKNINPMQIERLFLIIT